MNNIPKKPDLTNLAEYKTYKYNSIDLRSGELIAQGFVYNAKTFSMSANAQNNLLGTIIKKDVLTYPFAWNTKDNSETYQIADATDMDAFFMTALGTKKAHQDSGSALKALVTAATTVAEVEAVVDAR